MYNENLNLKILYYFRDSTISPNSKAFCLKINLPKSKKSLTFLDLNTAINTICKNFLNNYPNIYYSLNDLKLKLLVNNFQENIESVENIQSNLKLYLIKNNSKSDDYFELFRKNLIEVIESNIINKKRKK